ncbi:ferredoxin [Hoeflea sp. Naph1]|uniref:ferredoxin n=1 Tax=Hoeflea sp. Naph1 TaxID=3388653 RepID=UPI00398FCBA8
MSPMPASAETRALENALAEKGLRLRGWMRLDATSAPIMTEGALSSALCLVGHAGGEFWPSFAEWCNQHPGTTDPLDSWSKAVIAPIAAAAGGEAVFPSDRPWHPFQQWAMAAEGLKASPLGMLIHPEFGLWHGYRGAILFGAEAAASFGVAEAERAQIRVSPHPCDSCVDKPCLLRCPVGAFTHDGLAVSTCREYLASDNGKQGCMVSGCLAREACPVGLKYRYGEVQMRFHMAAFA